METFASFLRIYAFQENTAAQTVSSQAYGPYLRITPQVEHDGRITVTGKVRHEETTSPVTGPNLPLPVVSATPEFTLSALSGKALELGSTLIDGVQTTIQLTATLLPPRREV